MPIPVGCQCGKRFQAKDELAGKKVKCPGCGNVLTIPQPQPAGIAGGIDDLFGPGGGDPLFNSGSMAANGMGGAGMPGSAGPPRPRRKKGPNMVLIAGIAGGGVGLLLILVVVLVVVLGGRRGGNDVAVNPAPVVPAAAATVEPITGASTAPPPPTGNAPAVDITTGATPPPSATPPPTADDEEEAAPAPEAGADSASTENSGNRKAMSTAMTSWHAKADGKFRGAFPAEDEKDEEVIVYHYSWMTQVLPYLGYEKIHKRIDFKKPWTDRDSYFAAQYRIPQFLNPSDDRKSWKGYQFPNMGLTHFVGMSGVEETRQEVAATLSRSHERAGIFGYEDVAKESDITDGKSQTIMMIGSGELIGPWILGGGATVRGARAPHVDEATGEKKYDYFNTLDGFGSRGQTGALTLMADGSARTLSPNMDPALFRALCTTHGKDTVDLAQAGTALDKFPTQDFDPFKNEQEIKITIVQRIGDGGDDDDDDDDSSDSSSDDDDDDDSGSDDE
jgi:hypothetical protein